MWSYLIEVRLEEMHLLAILEQPGPVLLLELFLLELDLHGSRVVKGVALVGVDLGVEI